MPATALNPTARYIPVGKRQYYWVPTIAAANHEPTRTELDAGTDLTGEIPQDGVTGFTTTSNAVATGDMKSRFTANVPGLITADDSSIAFYNDEDGDDIRTVLSRDDEGHIVIFPEGDDDGATLPTAHTMDIFPVKVQSVSKQQSGADPATIVVSFSISSEPVEDIPVPAGT